ncbi:hypothetical protein MHYP_G00175360 [Metynnis hypsauchen]
MDQVLSGLSSVQCYLDDILVTGKTDEEHLSNLSATLQRLHDFGLRVRKDKCEFFKQSVEYLGHVIDSEGLHKASSKVKAIVDAPAPQNVSQLRSFLGLLNYYGKFIKNLATMLKPLHELLCQGKQWKWTEQCNQAFIKAKEALLKSKVLTHFNPKLPLQLACDASPYGVGAVLSHIMPSGDDRPIAFASRTLNRAERGYAQIEREALGIVFGVRKFYQYLFGKRFTLLTDHRPLTTIFGPYTGIPSLAASRMQRWALMLSAHTYDIKYRKCGTSTAIPVQKTRTFCPVRVSAVGKTGCHSITLEENGVTAATHRSLWNGADEGDSEKLFLVAGLDRDIEETAKSCAACQKLKNVPQLSPLHPWDWPETPWQQIHVDFAGPFEDKMFLVVVDAHSKWPEIAVMRSTSTAKTIEKLGEMFSRFGYPEQLVSDNGPQFISHEFASFMQANGVHHIKSAPYHPSTNGLAERMVQTMKHALKASHGKETLHQRLHSFLLSYRNTTLATTKTSPATLMLSRSLRTNFELLKPPSVKEVVHRQHQAQIDRRAVKAKSRMFSPGQHVLARNYTPGPKWVPASVIAQTGPVSYTVQTSSNVVWRRHADQLLLGSAPEEMPLITEPEMPVSSKIHVDQHHPDKSGVTEEETPKEAVPITVQTSATERRYPARERRPPTRLTY